MRFLPVLAAVLALGMTAATAWTILGSPDLVDEVPPTPVPTPSATAPQPVSVSVKQGEGVIQIGDALEDAGVIDSASQFRVLVALLGYDRMLQAGDYEFEPNMPALQVVYRMRRGIVSPNFVTVIEGWRLEEIADALDDEGIVSREEFLKAAVAGNFDEFDFLRRLGPQTPLEGYLLPATYFYRRSDTAEDVIQQMLEAMDKGFTKELRSEALDAGLTMHGVLTLASIIEREAQVAAERPIMAQVFLKRLRLGIALEADPTVQYAVAEDPASVEEFGYWKTELTNEDLGVDSLYNTYRYGGLPPGPISAPRMDSILAVIHPADTNYLYFVAKPDGSHAFAETFEEHQRNIEEFLR
ncbi:MAG: endolytic transglycosylase MltG [Dehalococcoidia bacterium]|nr:endolytic transglycosylase MltG [Dehalococcoidia bacterium]